MKTKGWKNVFGFTFTQYVKSKSFIASTIVVCLLTALLAAAANILPKLLGDDEEIVGEGDKGSIASITQVYVMDEAELLTDEDYSLMRENGIALTESGLEFNELIDAVKNTGRQEALVLVSADVYENVTQGFRVKTYYSPSADGKAVDALTSYVSGAVNYRNMLNAGVSQEKFLESQRYVSTSKIEAGSDEWNMLESAINYFVPIGVSIVLFLLIYAYGSTVAQSIATEKTSRVMELLLTSVRPLAVVIGKVLAMGVISFGQFMLIGIVGSVTFFATMPFGIGGDIAAIMNDPALQQTVENAEIVEAMNNTLGNINLFTILMILVIFILGFLFFSLIAALVGASISRMEDLQQAMQPYALLGVIGMYLAYFPVLFNIDSMETGAATMNPVQMFSYFFPASSPFALPSAMLLGTLSPLMSAVAVVILAVFVVLLAIVVGKVYEAIILHNGNRIKMGDIFKMAVRK